MTISKSGAGEVTSADIEADGDVEILDDSVHIATISANGDMNVEMRLKSGGVTFPPNIIMTKTYQSVIFRLIRFIRQLKKLITALKKLVRAQTPNLTN